MKNDFEFKYSAPTNEERKEIERIRNSYLAENTPTKLQELRRLNDKVNNLPTVCSLIIGVAGILVFGLGFSMILEFNMLVWGVVVGVFGVFIMIFAYFAFKLLRKFLKDKYASEIIKLSDELLNEDKKESKN